MTPLVHRTSKLLAVLIAYDGSITPYVRVRQRGTMRETLNPHEDSVVARQPVNFTFSTIKQNPDGLEVVEAMASIELTCWRPHYPFVTTAFIGAAADWPFGAGDLPQRGATTPGIMRNEFSISFDPASRRASWTNTDLGRGTLQLDELELEMFYFTFRIYGRTKGNAGRLNITGGWAFQGRTEFVV
jgi:hypothetical protein